VVDLLPTPPILALRGVPLSMTIERHDQAAACDLPLSGMEIPEAEARALNERDHMVVDGLIICAPARTGEPDCYLAIDPSEGVQLCKVDHRSQQVVERSPLAESGVTEAMLKLHSVLSAYVKKVYAKPSGPFSHKTTATSACGVYPSGEGGEYVIVISVWHRNASNSWSVYVCVVQM
jgi:hypothetical protein